MSSAENKLKSKLAVLKPKVFKLVNRGNQYNIISPAGNLITDWTRHSNKHEAKEWADIFLSTWNGYVLEVAVV